MRQKGPGIWEVRVYLGRDEAGRVLQRSRTVHGGERAARAELNRLLSQEAERRQKGAPAKPEETTVAELLEKWFHYLVPSRQPGTLRGYRTIINRVNAQLGNIPLSKLGARDLDRAYRYWLTHGMSPRTVHHTHVVLGTALHQAVKWRLGPEAVTALATPPKVPQNRVPVISPETVWHLAEGAGDDKPILAAIIVLAAITGCRRGELCGLRWSDIEGPAGAKVLYVRQAIKHQLDRREVEPGPTKTHQERRIALDAEALKAIAALRARAETTATEAGVDLDPDGYLFSTDPAGRVPLKPDTVTEQFRTLAKKLGLKVRFHDLRHFTATQLLGANVDPRTVAGRLGHADPSITMRVYAGFLQEKDREAAEALGGILRRAQTREQVAAG